METLSSPIRPAIGFTSSLMTDEVRPYLSFAADHPEAWRFRRLGTLQVPSMIDLMVQSQGVYADLMLDIRSSFFPENHQACWDVTAFDGEEPVGTARFWLHYAQHQIIIPLSRFHRAETALRIEASPVGQQFGPPPGPTFKLNALITDKRHLWRELEERSIWLFSTARSGSTWLAHDILNWSHRARVIDESGLGRMFAPLDWDTERFFNLHRHTAPFENGLAYETRQRPRSTPQMPPFERAFKDMRHETRMFNLVNEALYHRLLRDCALEHVLNEWGVLGYDRLVFKMPNDSHGADFIMRAFPRAWMIFLMRDGRDVMRSRFTPFASDILAETTDASLRTQAIAYYAHFWNFQVDIMRDAYDAHAADRRHFLRYEDLRQSPAEEIPSLLNRIGVAVTDEALPRLLHDVTLENMPADQRGPDKPRQDGRIGGFRDTFSPAEIELMNNIMGANLRRYGYETD